MLLPLVIALPLVLAATTPPQDQKKYKPPIPRIPEELEVAFNVHDATGNRTWHVREWWSGEQRAVQLDIHGVTRHCVWNTTTNDGHFIDGVLCQRASQLPGTCFCDGGQCFPYVELSRVLRFVNLHNASFHHTDVNSLELMSIMAKQTDVSFNVSYIIQPNKKWKPIHVRLEALGTLFGFPSGELNLTYHISSWEEKVRFPEYLRPQPGVACPQGAHSVPRPIPPLADQFSLSVEVQNPDTGGLGYESMYLDSTEQVVAFEYRPQHVHGDRLAARVGDSLLEPIYPFWTTSRQENPHSFRVIHDFKTELQYTVEEMTGNCTVRRMEPQPLSLLQQAEHELRLRHAHELLTLTPASLAYTGNRTVRGVDCDVWVGQLSSTQGGGTYATLEVYFSVSPWGEGSESSSHRVPIGLTTFITDEGDTSKFTHLYHTYFYGYRVHEPHWEHFDISPCLNRINRLFLVITLEVEYEQLIQYSFQQALDTIRRAVAGIAGVSPLRLVDFFVTDSTASGEVDVWFVLLEKPTVMGDEDDEEKRPQLQMKDAFQLLQDITARHHVSIRLTLAPDRHMLVNIKQGSLRTTSEAVHPRTSHRILHFVRAGFTSGSMAGLGFSMAVLGMCIGILAGFLLWKRQSPHIPYHITR